MSAVVLAFLFVAHTHTHRAAPCIICEISLLFIYYITIVLFHSPLELRFNRNANISVVCVCVYTSSFTQRIIQCCSAAPPLRLLSIVPINILCHFNVTHS